jgi:hypothetical protein
VNFKVRRNIDDSTYNKFQDFEYSNFGGISEGAMNDVLAALRTELTDIGLQSKYRFDKLGFVAPVMMPTDKTKSAEFHAEMQLVAYFRYELNQDMRGWYVGVNKPCCEYCTPALEEHGVSFAASHALKVINWKGPSSQRAMLKKEYSITT